MWWDTLPLDFWRENERFELRLQQRAQVAMTAAIDVVTRTFAATMVGTTALPLGFSPARLKTIRQEGEFYARFAERPVDEGTFFVPPSHDVRVERFRPTWPYFAPPKGRCEDLRFESPYAPMNEAFREEYLRARKNHRAHARYFFHDDRPRPTIVAIHGFSADFYALNEWFFALPWFYDQGCDVMIFTMPHHGKRGSGPFSGHGFFAGGVAGINESFGQAVHDFRVFTQWLRKHRGVEKIGVTGVSLGGYTTALLAALEPSLAFAVPNVPLVSIPDVALEWHPVSEVIRTAMRISGVGLVELRRMLAVSSPLSYLPVLPKERLMIIGGMADKLAPPKHSRVLWEHWDKPRLHWFPGSHLLHLDRGRYLRRLTKYFAGLGFLE